MTSKQTDTVAMTEEQLDGVSGGPHIRNWDVGITRVLLLWHRSSLLSGRTPAQNISPPANEHLLPAVQQIGY